MSTLNTGDERHQQHRHSAMDWAHQFAASVRSRDFEQGATLFSPDVHAFGTRCLEAHGLDELVLKQWNPTWLRTTDFDFLPDSVHVEPSDDDSMALVTALWQSHGVDRADLWGAQTPYLRSGRCTFVLRRLQNGTWKCIHSHFSMIPDALNPP